MTQRTDYRLTSGTFRTEDGEKHTPGAIVALTDEQYDAHGYKFEPVAADDEDDGDDEATTDTEDTAAAEAVNDDVDASIPDDWPDLVSMAGAWEGDEVDGNSSREDIVAHLESLTDTQVIDLKIDAGVA